MSAETTDRPRVSQMSEALPIPEKPKTNFPFITINGRAGTGKSSLAKAMSEDFGLQVFDIGKIFRRWDGIFGQKSDMRDYAPRIVEADQKLDFMVRRRMLRAIQSNQPVVIVSRYGGIIAKELANQGYPDSPRVDLTASDEIAARRVFERDNKNIFNPVANNEKAIEETMRKNARRNTKDFHALKAAHPDLPGNPMNRNLKNSKGERIYNIVINTNTLSVREMKEELYQELEEKGFLAKAD